jgi:UDP-N-acetyl-D-galactosamine dehydrogenase
VSIYDPYLSESSDNNFISNPFVSEEKYDAIILAVAHNKFLKYSIDDFHNLSKGKLVFLDLKGIYEKSSWKL